MNNTNIPGVAVVSVRKNHKHIGPDEKGRLEETVGPDDKVELLVVTQVGYGFKKIVQTPNCPLVAIDSQKVAGGNTAHFWKMVKVHPGKSGLGYIKGTEATLRLARADHKNGKFCVYDIWIGSEYGGHVVTSRKVHGWQFFRGDLGQLLCPELLKGQPEMLDVAKQFFPDTKNLPHIRAWMGSQMEEAIEKLDDLLDRALPEEPEPALAM